MGRKREAGRPHLPEAQEARKPRARPANGLRRPPLPPNLGRAAAGAEAWRFGLGCSGIPVVFLEVDVRTEPFLPSRGLRPEWSSLRLSVACRVSSLDRPGALLGPQESAHSLRTWKR